ncbi:unnamed protein product [Schistosoma mattheei]|uniref:Secreted protein n=2 Tax=Schistosoma TaxID=6181 RepID=A0A183JLS9_9TREM|nr:unnamed protein product [Schistosoma curassoni]VDP60264.1 unnamed protein product [Schistosoma mattheei]
MFAPLPNHPIPCTARNFTELVGSTRMILLALRFWDTQHIFSVAFCHFSHINVLLPPQQFHLPPFKFNRLLCFPFFC